MPIHFGTDGWRAVISDTFTFSNLRLVSQAIADALRSENWNNGIPVPADVDKNRVVVGLTHVFYQIAMRLMWRACLAANGFQVFLAHADAPTPVISYAVHNLKAYGGVMITASHNAPRYNGIKLKAAYGGSALPEQCRRVEVYLNDNEERGRGPNLMDFDQARQAGLIQKFNPLIAYYDHIAHFDQLRQRLPKTRSGLWLTRCMVRDAGSLKVFCREQAARWPRSGAK